MILPLPIPFLKRRLMIEPKAETESIDAPSGKVFDGIKLHPYSPMRQVVSLSLGVSGQRSDRMSDAILVVWLCTLTDWQVAKAHLRREQAVLDAHQFAVEHNATLLNFGPIVEAYQQVMTEIDATLSNASKG
jgi:hypothetical protein